MAAKKTAAKVATKAASKPGKAKAGADGVRKHGDICCVSCGTGNGVEYAGLPGGALQRCSKCGKPPVEAFMLLTALGLNPFDDSNDCPGCGRTNSIHHAHCFGCGRKLGKG